jgi:Fic family protein
MKKSIFSEQKILINNLLEEIDQLKQKLLSHNIFEEDQLICSLEQYYNVRLTYTSNFIEGFTYSEEETYNLIVKNQPAPSKSALETGAVRGHDLCFKHMITLQNDEDFEEPDLLKYHELLSGGLENNAIPGRYRDKDVRVGDQIFIPSFKVKSIMKQMFELLEVQKEKLHPVLYAIKCHKDIIFIHPFMDGNGRVARLAMNTIMLQNKYLPIDISPQERFNYQKSILESYKVDSSFYIFMLNQAIKTYSFILDKLEKGIGNFDYFDTN